MDDDGKKTLTPKLRFPRFIGQPLREVQLKDVTAESATRNGEKLATTSVMGVTKADGIVPMEERLIAPDIARYKVVQKDWFAYNPMRLNIGSIARWQGEGDILVSPDYVVFKCIVDSGSGIDPAYLDHFRRSGAWEDFVTEGGDGSVRVRIYYEDLARLKLALPSLAEQQKIADCLTSLNEVIAAQARKVEALKAHKKGLMQQLFPREGETLPRLRFPEFRKTLEWSAITLGQLVEVASGQVDPTEPPYCDCPQVGSENIESDTGKLRNVKSAREKGVMSGNYPFDENDILYSKIRPALNKVAAPEFKGICSADIYPIRSASGELVRRYLFYLLLSEAFLDYATMNSARGKIPKINRDALLAYGALIPPPAEQQRIADCLSSLDAQIAAETERFDALKTHKKGLMQQLFSVSGISQQLPVGHTANQTESHASTLRIANTTERSEPAVAPARKPYKIGFARQLLAAEILQHCHQHPTMGRVKLQKLIHLCEYHAELDDIHGDYARAAAGPFDNKLMRGVASGLEKQKWFKEVRGEKRAFYEPMESSSQHTKYLQRWSKQLPKIHEIIRLFATAGTSTCEIASTLYAAWNDLLIEGRKPTDAEIIREASDPNRWHESKANIDKTKWPAALNWMREKGLVPRGYGAHTTRRIG